MRAVGRSRKEEGRRKLAKRRRPTFGRKSGRADGAADALGAKDSAEIGKRGGGQCSNYRRLGANKDGSQRVPQ